MWRGGPACLIVAVLLAVASAPARGAPAVELAAMPPADVVSGLASAISTGDASGVTPWLTEKAQGDLRRLTEQDKSLLEAIGTPCPTTIVSRTEQPAGTALSVDAACPNATVRWRIVFSDAQGLIDSLALDIPPAAPAAPGADGVAGRPRAAHHAAHRRMAPRPAGSTAAAPPPPAPPPPPAAPQETAAAAPADQRSVEFLLATTRKTETQGPLRFTADRADGLTYGIVQVHVPVDHKAGQVERPARISLAGFTLYEEKLDEKKHFVVTGARLIGEDDFDRFATNDPARTALVFVHGFNNTFEDSAYRFAQILYDLHYDHPAILFSWASKGSVVDYLYDKDSAEIARDRFAQLIRALRARGVEKIEVVAHSMGNYLAVAALADSARTADPDRVDQLIMAAPDMARDYLVQEAPKLRQVAQGMTLYACATDRALRASKDAAGGVPRAGDVPPDGPLVIPGIDTIDVSALGADWFGLNHDVFASNRSVMDDIVALLKGAVHPPRLADVQGMPAGMTPPRFWRFAAP